MAHSLPRDVTFEDVAVENNSGPRWTSPTLWWPGLLWNVAAEPDQTTGHDIYVEKCDMHDGYADGEAACQHTAATATVPKVAAYVFKDAQSEDCSVQANFKVRTVAGNWTFDYNNGRTLCYGVMARVTGAAGGRFTAAAGVDDTFDGLSCYALIRTGDFRTGQFQNYYSLVRIIGPGSPGGNSSIALLAYDREEAPASQWEDQHKDGRTQGLRIDIATDGAVADISCYRINGLGREVELFTHSDSGGSAILETGHGGMLMLTEGQGSTSGDKYAFTCANWQITDGTDILARDEWVRTNLLTTQQTSPDHNGYRGRSLCGKFMGDHTGIATWDDRLRRDSSLPYIPCGTTPVQGIHLMYDPADNPYKQSRTLTANWEAAGSGSERVAGVILRGSVAGTAEFTGLGSGYKRTGYCVVVWLAGGGTWSVRVYRWNNDESTLIASRLLNVGGDPFTAAVGSDIDITFSIENKNGPSHADGNVHLDIQFDSNKLTGWTMNESVAIYENDDGTLTDASSDRLLSGPAQGFYSYTNHSNDVLLKEFTQETVTFDLDEREQEGVPVSLERSGAVQTLDVPHEWPVSVKHISYDIEQGTETGYTRRHRAGSATRRIWTISSRAATGEEIGDLRQLLLDAGGWNQPVNWTTPEGENVIVRLDKDRFVIRKVDRGVYAFSLTLNEALGPEPADAGFAGRFATGDASASNYYNVHYEEDGTLIANSETGDSASTVNPRPITIEFDKPTEGAGLIYYELSGTAVYGTNYTLSSDSPIQVPSGVESVDLDITLIDRGRWYIEREAIIKLVNTGGAVNLGDLTKTEYHIGIRPNPGEVPDVEFKATTSNPGASETFLEIPFLLSAASDEHTLGNVRAVSTGSISSYTLVPGRINAGETDSSDPTGGLDIRVKDIVGAVNGDTITLYLDHEPDDGSEENFWTKTNDPRNEDVDYSLPISQQRWSLGLGPFAGEPSTGLASGGNLLSGFDDHIGLVITKQSDSIHSVDPDDIKLQPDGSEMWVIQQSPYIGSQWNDFYWRESFQSAKYSGTTGRKQQFEQYCLMSWYVDTFPTGIAEDGQSSYFVTLNHRNRAPGDMEMGVVFQRHPSSSTIVSTTSTGEASVLYTASGTAAYVHTDTGYWGLWAKERVNTNARWGVVEETIDGNNYTRLWVMTNYSVTDGTDWYETNNSTGTETGTATSGSSSTRLEDTGRDFVNEGFGVGDVVRNTDDGSWAHITGVATTQVTHTSLRDGQDNNWGSPGGDDYRIWKNHRGTCTAGGSKTLLVDSAGGFSAYGTMLLKEIKNETTGELVTIVGVQSDTTIETEEAGTAWTTGHSYTIRRKSMSPTTAWSGNAIFRSSYATPSDSYNSVNSSTTRWGGNSDILRWSGLCVWGPLYVTKSTTFSIPPPPYDGHATPGTAAPGRFWPKLGHWPEPLGNAYLKLAGNTSHTITFGP